MTTENQTIYLKDYQLPTFVMSGVELDFDLFDDKAIVTASVDYMRQREAETDLFLYGEGLDLLSIHLDGRELTSKDYSLNELGLSVHNVPDAFNLTIETKIYPALNKSFEGLYMSEGKFCTQCEAEGFRKITFFLDRPDCLSHFTTTIWADKNLYPVLLSNGDLIAEGEQGDRHYATWRDPHKKPSYLFALVAGDLQHVAADYLTSEGRKVTLRLYTEAHNIQYCDYALQALIRSMKWDEARFGLAYDLDTYMIVAVDDFNMGAMENKGLNIFNSKLVFASAETATDNDFMAIESVIGHEYFHNWTGNRVTCRDWFQLSLKEGLTVFRDQEFSADLHSRAAKRVEDVRMLKRHQFSEDASPLAHPVRPPSFVEINNFYTLTIYEKGAEVVRMYHSLLGEAGFQKGMQLYFKRHDGQAVTTEDFLAAMADANQRDLSQMQQWYEQPGTPVLKVRMDYDAEQKTCQFQFQQSNPTAEQQGHDAPLLIPMRMSLLDNAGKTVVCSLVDVHSDEAVDIDPRSAELRFAITAKQQTLTIDSLDTEPVPVFLHELSAPVLLEYEYSESALIQILRHSTQAFSRWQASQDLAKQNILAYIAAQHSGQAAGLSHDLIEAYQYCLNDEDLDQALRAEILRIPECAEIQQWLDEVNPSDVVKARQWFIGHLAKALQIDLEALYDKLNDAKPYALSDAAISQRMLKNTVLQYMAQLDDRDRAVALAEKQYRKADNMTDAMAALSVLSHIEGAERDQALADFYQRWQDNPQVVTKWLALHSGADVDGVIEQLQALEGHPAFDVQNPNKLRALIGHFAMNNYTHFHQPDGSGYRYLADKVIEVEKFNPQVAARLVRAMTHWQHYQSAYADQMKHALQTVQVHAQSKDVLELVTTSLGH